MRTKTATHLREMFDNRIKVAFPQFSLVKKADIPRGDRLYESQRSKSCYTYLMLCQHTNDDRFTVDVAWSRQLRFPTHLISMFPFAIPEFEISRSEPIDGEFRTRIGLLFHPYQDRWWKASDLPGLGELSFDQGMDYVLYGEKPYEPNEQLIAESIEEVIGCIRQYAIPYLEHVSLNPES